MSHQAQGNNQRVRYGMRRSHQKQNQHSTSLLIRILAPNLALQQKLNLSKRQTQNKMFQGRLRQHLRRLEKTATLRNHRLAKLVQQTTVTQAVIKAIIQALAIILQTAKQTIINLSRATILTTTDHPSLLVQSRLMAMINVHQITISKILKTNKFIVRKNKKAVILLSQPFLVL